MNSWTSTGFPGLSPNLWEQDFLQVQRILAGEQALWNPLYEASYQAVLIAAIQADQILAASLRTIAEEVRFLFETQILPDCERRQRI